MQFYSVPDKRTRSVDMPVGIMIKMFTEALGWYMICNRSQNVVMVYPDQLEWNFKFYTLFRTRNQFKLSSSYFLEWNKFWSPKGQRNIHALQMVRMNYCCLMNISFSTELHILFSYSKEPFQVWLHFSLYFNLSKQNPALESVVLWRLEKTPLSWKGRLLSLGSSFHATYWYEI